MVLGTVTSEEEEFHKQLAKILRKSLKFDNLYYLLHAHTLAKGP